MPVIYELRGKSAEFSDLGLNLYSGCAVGCRYCGSIWLHRTTWEQWTAGARPRPKILQELDRDAKKMAGDPREILISPASEPYQSDEAARLTRKALLILEQYRLRVQITTLCGMRSTADFDICANHWKYATQILFTSERLREEWEPGGRGLPRAFRRIREAHAGRNLYLGETLSRGLSKRDHRRGRDAAGRRGRVEDRQTARRRTPAASDCRWAPGFVDADTALAYLRRMVERGLSDKCAPQKRGWCGFPTRRAKGKATHRRKPTDEA